MGNSIGNSVVLTLFGESHGMEIGAVLDGMAPGIAVSEAEIAAWLSERRPQDEVDTARREPDRFRVVSGVFNGYTTGAPICILIPNEDVKSGDYEAFHGLARPSHADYTAYMKYKGFEDYRGGGHFSGRITAGIVAVGAIALKALKNKGIDISTKLIRCGGIEGDEKCMREAVLQAKAENDSVGGVVQTVVTGLPAGIGNPWFDSVEGAISKGVFAIGGVKGIEFGAGFQIADMRGSEANDSLYYDNGKVLTRTNNSGGVNGGITNGMPVVFNTAIKPTPSIGKIQQTIDFLHETEAELKLSGRHDPAIVRRICPVITSMTAIVLCDLIALEYGTDYLR